MSNIAWDYAMTPVACGADFYQLAEFADGDCVRRHLGGILGRYIDEYAIHNVRYIAGRSLEVVYRIPSEQIVTVRFLQPGASASAFITAKAAAARPELVHYMPAWNAISWMFPEDPGLPGIPALIAQSVGMIAHDGARVSWNVLSYLPGERCAIRCLSDDGLGIVAKLRRGPGAVASHQTVQRLWDATDRYFRMPQPITADEALGARWERFVAGERLEVALTKAAPGPLLADVARNLVHLHTIHPSNLPSQGPDQILRLIEKVLHRVRVVLPNLLDPAEALARTLATTASDLLCQQPVTLHGDLHTANVIVDDTGPVFIDLDSLAAGDPAYDIALLGSRLLLSALSRGDDIGQALTLIASLPDWYGEAGGTSISNRVYTWYIAALLLGRQVKTCIRHSAPSTSRIAPTLLEVARATLERGRIAAA